MSERRDVADRPGPSQAGRTTDPAAPEQTLRRPYAPPRLEPLGAWSALTLQQTVPIGPGVLLGKLPFA